MDPARLSAIAFFAELTAEELAPIAATAYEVEAVPGHTITKEGDFGHAVYAIESGTAEVRSNGRLIRTLGPGDLFGEIAVIAAGRRSASVTATTPMRLIALFKRDVWALESQAPTVSARLRALLAEHQA